MRHKLSFLLMVTTVFLLFASAPARAKDAGGSVLTSTLEVLSPVAIGGTMLKPGTYTVKAEGSTVTLARNGKTVAQANVEWKDSGQKAQATTLLAESGTVKEIHFGGKSRYVEIAQ